MTSEEQTPAERPVEVRHRVMIVDDDPVSRGLLVEALADDCLASAYGSGEDCLAVVGHARPDVVMLDIAMPGLDGFETCRRLRAMDTWATVDEQPAVIFVSAHDGLEDRLHAYDSGGDDFVTKPAQPDEVQRKVRAMVRLIADRRRLRTEKDAAQQTAMGFLTNLGESGTQLRFMRDSLACESMQALAELAIAACGEYGLTAQLQVRPPGEVLTFVGAGRASPLEESVFEKVRELGRIFQFRRQLVINYPHVSLQVKNLPTEDEDRCGRLRDHLALIAEGCEASALGLIRSAEVATRTRQLRATAAAVEEAIAALRDQYRDQQAATSLILHELHLRVTERVFLMGLSETEEKQFEGVLTTEIDKALELFQRGLDFDARLGEIMRIVSADVLPRG